MTRRGPRDDLPLLTPRQGQVLALLAGGQTQVQVAISLGISRETVKTLLDKARARLGAATTIQAVVEAARLDLLGDLLS